ncbi:MAG TPA: DUF1326 domain-containing protein [Chthonomonadaceae bacterium]|jgi:hypothetical protein|nr:DUF1326 domain-containing protein [Chthonomonadaceae bacterium]
MTSILLALFFALGTQAAPHTAAWQATGTLLECCTCAVPCTCNFGQGPSPNAFCHTIYAYRLKAARYAGVTLDGLIFGGGEGPQGAFGFLDSRATTAQRPALQKLALAVFAKGGASPGERRFAWTRVTAEDNARQFRIQFEGSGGFTAEVLLGGDGKNPIIVENNLTWPVHRFIKGKTTRFDYKDPLGNRLHYEGTNANLGEFHLSGIETSHAGRVPRTAEASCCSLKR